MRKLSDSKVTFLIILLLVIAIVLSIISIMSALSLNKFELTSKSLNTGGVAYLDNGGNLEVMIEKDESTASEPSIGFAR